MAVARPRQIVLARMDEPPVMYHETITRASSYGLFLSLNCIRFIHRKCRPASRRLLTTRGRGIERSNEKAPGTFLFQTHGLWIASLIICRNWAIPLLPPAI